MLSIRYLVFPFLPFMANIYWYFNDFVLHTCFGVFLHLPWWLCFRPHCPATRWMPPLSPVYAESLWILSKLKTNRFYIFISNYLLVLSKLYLYEIYILIAIVDIPIAIEMQSVHTCILTLSIEFQIWLPAIISVVKRMRAYTVEINAVYISNHLIHHLGVIKHGAGRLLGTERGSILKKLITKQQ